MTLYKPPKPPNRPLLSLNIMTWPRAGQPEVRGSTPGRRNRLLSSAHLSDHLSTHPPPCSTSSFPANKIADVMNEWSYTYSPPIHHHGLQRQISLFIHQPLPSLTFPCLYFFPSTLLLYIKLFFLCLQSALFLLFLTFATCVILSVRFYLFQPAPTPSDTLIDPDSY